MLQVAALILAVIVTVIVTLINRKAKAEQDAFLMSLIKRYEIKDAYVDYGDMPLLNERD